ncbi:MAG: hypothetical protein HC880_10005, partial [Bacteroidia bacterium]|nr:hypothetical protein [Bacteroidia bacterium]
RMRFPTPVVVTPERVRRAYATCRPGFFPPIDPCLMPDPLIHPSTPGTGSSSAPGGGTSPGSWQLIR